MTGPFGGGDGVLRVFVIFEWSFWGVRPDLPKSVPERKEFDQIQHQDLVEEKNLSIIKAPPAAYLEAFACR